MGTIIESQQEQQCIWVEAGVLNYKLCDREFRCEHCPLDAALRDHDASCRDEYVDLEFSQVKLPERERLPEAAVPLLTAFLSLQICQDVQYSSRHVWVRTLPNGLVKCGLDAFAAALLPDDAQIIVVANNTPLREGEEFGWMYGGNHALPLSAPVSGSVVCRNKQLRTTAQAIRMAPYQDGAIVTLSPDVGALAHARLSSPRNHMRRLRKRVRLLTERVERLVASPEIGPCLNDGGAPVSSLRHLLGEERYWNIVAKFIGGE